MSMKVKQLIEALKQLEADECFVLVASDPEGNLYRDIEEVVFENSEVVIYPNDECYQQKESGEFYNLNEETSELFCTEPNCHNPQGEEMEFCVKHYK